jgi:hypothetical protein
MRKNSINSSVVLLSFLLFSGCVLFHTQPKKVQPSVATTYNALLKKYPSSSYIMSFGNGQNISQAKLTATNDLAQQIESNIKETTQQNTSANEYQVAQRFDMYVNSRTHVKLFGVNVVEILGNMDEGYTVFVVVNKKMLEVSINGELSAYRTTISEILKDITTDKNMTESTKIQELEEIIKIKRRASYLATELDSLNGTTPTGEFDPQTEISRVNDLLEVPITPAPPKDKIHITGHDRKGYSRNEVVEEPGFLRRQRFERLSNSPPPSPFWPIYKLRKDLREIRGE